jgi:hypothetical protein
MSAIAEAAFIKPEDGTEESLSAGAPSAFGGGEWYPTLQRTITLLAKIHSSLPVWIVFNYFMSFLAS